jgi:mono/diheme cytochrome c family protein
MPPFAWRYDDDDVAQLATFVRSSWGNQGPAVTAQQVAAVRAHVAH